MITRRYAALAAVLTLLAAMAPAAVAEGYTLPAPVTGVTSGERFSAGYQFCPFGWSADGKFAWMESRDIDGRGGTIYTYVVYDTVEDATVYSRFDDSFDWGTEETPTPEESWKRCASDVSAALAESGILQAADITVQPFPLRRAGDTYTASLAVKNDPQRDGYDEQRVQSYVLRMKSAARGSKTVTSREQVGAAKVRIAGYILSPAEPRVLVVVSTLTRAFEGYEETLYFYGAHLGVGFRK
jgi:hypothetical protein